jgi:hypothetical protein
VQSATTTDERTFSTGTRRWRILVSNMCRNIRVLHNFQPPTTPEEIHAAALQYVRKVSGIQKPSTADEKAFEKAIDQVAATTAKLLDALVARSVVRTRDGEREKAKAKWASRAARIRDTG